MSILKNLLPEAPEAPRDMVLQKVGSGESVNYPRFFSGTERMQWVGKDGNVRIPQPVTKKYGIFGGFQAAGKHYLSVKQLTVQADTYGRWCISHLLAYCFIIK